MGIKGLIFDLDGTLLDSMPVWDDAGERYLRSKGIIDIPPGLASVLAPLSMKETIDYFNDIFKLAIPPPVMEEEINAQIADEYLLRVQLKPGVASFLEKNAHLKMCIATASNAQLVKKSLERLSVDRYFSFILTSGQVGNSKQFPDIFLQAARRLGCAPDEVIVFEDAPHAIETAKKAGFYVAAVSEKAFAAQRGLVEKTADWFVETFENFSLPDLAAPRCCGSGGIQVKNC